MNPSTRYIANSPRPTLRSFAASQLRGSSSAFTLIEIVVALALGVTLLVAVQGLVVSAFRASDEIERHAVHAAARTLPFDLLRQDLESQPAGGGLLLADNVLRLTTLNALRSSRPAARHAVTVQYAVEPSGSGLFRLTRRENELGKRNRKQPGVILADEISEVTLDVFDGRQWRDHWPPRIARTAYAARITIVWSDGERRQKIVRLSPLPWSRHDG